MATTIPAAATIPATAPALLALIPLSTTPAAAVTLIFLMALTGFTINLVVTALAVRFPGDAPTLTSSLTTSAHNTGIAAGSALAGRALASSLGVTGPALIGALFTGLTLLPLIALATAAQRGTTRNVTRNNPDAQIPAPRRPPKPRRRRPESVRISDTPFKEKTP